MGKMGFYQDEWGNGTSPYPATCFKQKNRCQFVIPSICASGVGSLPPLKSSRHSLSFKEMIAEHLNETISFPGKPDWKPITLTLYDIVKQSENPVFTWLRRVYDPKNCSYYKPCLEQADVSFQSSGSPSGSVKCAEAHLILYDRCGEVIETWVFEHVWPQSVEFAESDMASGDLVYCDVTLKYDRAYCTGSNADLNAMSTIIPYYNCESSSISVTAFAPLMPAEFTVERI